MSYATQSGEFNQLLASLPPDDGAYLASISRRLHPSQGQALTSRSAPGSDVWFPHSGVIALTATDAAGRSVQTGLIGYEGCVGLESVFGPVAMLPDASVQIGGAMTAIPAAQLRSAFSERPSIQAALFRFLYGLAAQSMQTVACNLLHSLVARCCRWLLTFQDRLASDTLALTQENLATLLGNGRPHVNRLLANLEKGGLVQRQRGHIRLLDRSGLEIQACGCYRSVRDVSASLHLFRT
jgi:CRP-like cAMP-binding protein